MKTLYSIIGAILGMLTFYLAASFAEWRLVSIAEWSFAGRSILLISGLGGSLIALDIYGVYRRG